MTLRADPLLTHPAYEIVDAEASGPWASVYEPTGLPPNQACEPP